MASLEHIGKVMTERDWVMWVNRYNVWSVGVERNGVLEVLGMGCSVEEAFDMAERSRNGRSDAEPN